MGARAARDERPQPAVIMLRQSPDWGRLDHRYLEETDAFDLIRNRAAGHTRRLIELWDATFDVSFFATRQAMKEIALASFAEVRGARLIPAGGAEPTPPPALALFTDDDDWFAPEIVDHLLPQAAAHDGLTWTWVRLDGLLGRRDSRRGFCYTNNYAVTRRFIDRRADWRAHVGQHWDAKGTFGREDFSVLHIGELLSIGNKHPCSIMVLEGAVRARPGRDGLIALVEDFNARAAWLRLPPELAWAAPHIEAVTAFFAGLMGTSRPTLDIKPAFRRSERDPQADGSSSATGFVAELVEVRTQAELEMALGREGVVPVCEGSGTFAVTEGSRRILVRGSSFPTIVAWESSSPEIDVRDTSSPTIEARMHASPTIVAWDSSSPTVLARGPSAPRIVAWEASSPRVEAWARSSPRIEARGFSSPRVEARESSRPVIEAHESSSPRVRAWESSAASGFVGEHALLVASKHSDEARLEIEGATVLEVPRIESASSWCEYYGVEVEQGIVTLYKALDDEYRSNQSGFQYLPGSKPEAADWDGGEAECGGGLHFAPHPALALQWFPGATRFVACPVRLSELVVHHPADYPQKVKAPRVCEPVYEVDRDGNRVTP